MVQTFYEMEIISTSCVTRNVLKNKLKSTLQLVACESNINIEFVAIRDIIDEAHLNLNSDVKHLNNSISKITHHMEYDDHGSNFDQQMHQKLKHESDELSLT